MKENKLNKLEQQLHEKLNEVSFDFQDKHWAQLKPKINKTANAVGFTNWLKVVAIVLLGAAGTYYFISDSNEIKNKSVLKKDINTPIIKNKIDASKTQKETISEKIVPESNTASKVDTEITESTKFSEKESLPIENSLEIVEENELEVSEEPLNEEMIVAPIEIESVSIIHELIIQGNICLGNEIQIIVNSLENDETNYSWNLNKIELDESTSSLKLKIDQPGIKTISVSNTISEKTIEFEVLELPEINFTYQDSKDAYWDEAAQLNATPDHLDYVWEIEGMENKIIGNNQTIDFEYKGLYDVNLVYIDQNGCEVSIEKPVSIQSDFDPLAPNVFTPDGDNINNDFIPKGFSETLGSFKMSIFDMNGKLVYKTLSRDEPWNGNENNIGSKLPLGVYVWKIEINHENRTKTYTGKFKMMDF